MENSVLLPISICLIYNIYAILNYSQDSTFVFITINITNVKQNTKKTFLDKIIKFISSYISYAYFTDYFLGKYVSYR